MNQRTTNNPGMRSGAKAPTPNGAGVLPGAQTRVSFFSQCKGVMMKEIDARGLRAHQGIDIPGPGPFRVIVAPGFGRAMRVTEALGDQHGLVFVPENVDDFYSFAQAMRDEVVKDTEQE